MPKLTQTAWAWLAWVFVRVGYWVRPYDMLADRRRWRWQPAQRCGFAGVRLHGDRCGCTDDRCIGFHHFGEDDCGCLPVLLDMYAKELRDAG